MKNSDKTEENKLISRINDMLDIASKKHYPVFSSFLDEMTVRYVSLHLKSIGCKNYRFYGGKGACFRKMLCVFPDYMEIDEESYPIIGISVKFPSRFEVGHRDVLGSLIALNITRESIGDIFIEKGICTLFVRESIYEVVKQDWKKIGKVGIKFCDEVFYDICKKPEFSVKKGTVASLRIDSVVALSAGISRQKALEEIKSSKVFLNGMLIEKPDFIVKEDDIFSIRGFGKYILSDQLGETRKGRIFIEIQKYV